MYMNMITHYLAESGGIAPKTTPCWLRNLRALTAAACDRTSSFGQSPSALWASKPEPLRTQRPRNWKGVGVESVSTVLDFQRELKIPNYCGL